jgi:mannose-1-phosphate guanylyltransferase
MRRTVSATSPPWVIVLAGGEGSRLREWAEVHLEGTPKPFCRFRDDRTLLGGTLERARRVTTSDRILVVVNEWHRDWWASELAGIPEDHVLSQPASRGTAVALLHAMVRAMISEMHPRLVLMPCDHELEDEEPFLAAIQSGLAEIARSPETPVLLGVGPEGPDREYGWIVAAESPGAVARQILTLVEKPSPLAAAELLRRGALWNTLVLIASGRGLLDLYENSETTLVESYLQALGWSEGSADPAECIYRLLPERDLMKDVLQKQAHRLRVIEVPACGWVDLGTAEHASDWMARHAPQVGLSGEWPRGFARVS